MTEGYVPRKALTEALEENERLKSQVLRLETMGAVRAVADPLLRRAEQAERRVEEAEERCTDAELARDGLGVRLNDAERDREQAQSHLTELETRARELVGALRRIDAQAPS